MADALLMPINPGFSLGGGGAAALFALDQTTDAIEFITQADKADTITKFAFRYGARTGTPPAYRASVQGVDQTTGLPDGTIKGGGSPASVAFTPPADTTWDAAWREVTLDNSYTPTRGEDISFVIKYASGTVDGSNFSTFGVTDSNSLYSAIEGHPYAITNNAGTRIRQGARPIFAYLSASAIYGYPNKANFTSAAFTSATNPNEIATCFTLPSSLGSTYQLGGVRIRTNVPAVTKSMKVQLYSGTAVLQTRTFDSDVAQAQNNRVFRVLFTETTLVDLNFGTQYRVGFQPQDATGNWTFTGLTLAQNSDWGAFPVGVDWFMSTRNGGAWTDDNTTRLSCELLLRDITKPVGGVGPRIQQVVGQSMPVY